MGRMPVFANLCCVDLSAQFWEFLRALAGWVLPVWTKIGGCGSRALTISLTSAAVCTLELAEKLAVFRRWMGGRVV